VGAIVLLVLVAVVGLPVFVGGAWPALAHRLSTLLSGAQHDPRIQIWGAAVSTFAHHPLFGVGAENLTFGLNLADPNVASQSPVGVAYYQFGVHAHDLFLTMAAERGVLGLGAFLWVCFALARVIQTGLGHAKEAERGLVLAIAASLTAVLAHGLVDYTLVDVIAASIMTLAGCAVVMSRRVPEAGPELHAQSS
jgi:O-antigen ligase